jgi:hypothetical protein
MAPRAFIARSKVPDEDGEIVGELLVELHGRQGVPAAA